MPGTHVLPDVLEPNLRVVFCGTAAGDVSASRCAYYAGPGNRFWATLHETGLTPRQLAPIEFTALPKFGIGLTDIAKLRSGNDAILKASDFDVEGFKRNLRGIRPRVIAFNGKKAASIYFDCPTRALSYGPRSGADDPAVFVLPSTSGSARGFWSIEPWRELAAFVGR